MNIQLKEELERRLAEALEKERELWKLHQETEKWSDPVIKRFEESRTRWSDQVRKCKILQAFLENEL